jgi:hypothetical protein
MSWKDDERLYQPRIHSRRIRELHSISEITGQPMTLIVDIALRRFTENYDLIPSPTLSDDLPLFVPEKRS